MVIAKTLTKESAVLFTISEGFMGTDFNVIELKGERANKKTFSTYSKAYEVYESKSLEIKPTKTPKTENPLDKKLEVTEYEKDENGEFILDDEGNKKLKTT